MALTTIDDRGLKTPIDLLDNEKIRFGTGNDLEIYHNGTNSIIDNNTGVLQITAASFRVNNAANNEVQIKALEDGAVELYHNDSKKLETASWGVAITGELTTTNHVNIPNDTGKFMVGASNDLQIYHDGSNSYIKDAGTGQLRILSNQLLIQNAAGDANQIICTESGSVDLHYDGTKKLETTSLGATITRDLTLNHASGDTALRWAVGGTNKFSLYESSGTLRFYDNTNSAERLRIDSSGRLLIGHTSSINSYGAESQLQVSGTGFANSSLAIRRDSADTGAGAIILSKSRGSQGGVTVVQSGDSLGEIVWCGADGGDANPSAGLIKCAVDGTPGTNDMPGRLEFYTTADGAGGVTERMRLDKNGKVTINPFNTFHSATHQATLTLSNESASNLYAGGKWSHAAIGIDNTTHTASGGSKSQIVFGYLPRSGGYDYEFGSAYMGATSVSQSGAGKVDLVFGTKDVTSDTQPTERLRILSGGGLTFNGDTAAANALDDYEEGGWNPAISYGVSSATFSTQYGRYTKIGNKVTVWFYIILNGGSTTSSTFAVSLPFTPAGSTMYTAFSGYNNLSANSIDNPVLIAFPAQANAYMYKQTATSVGVVPGTDVGNAAQQLWWGTYEV